MKLTSYLILFVIIILISGCTQPPIQSNYYLLNVQSTDCLSTEGFINYENDTIRVAYIFWAENGVMGVFIHNKLKLPLYVDWKKCSYITGTEKHNYWDETVTMTTNGWAETSSLIASQGKTTNTASKMTNYSSDSKTDYWVNFYNPLISSETHTTGKASSSSENELTTYSSSSVYSQTFWSSITRITKPERITFIPPATTICMALYTILPNNIFKSPSNLLLPMDTVMEMRTIIKKRIMLKYPIRYIEEDSITYSPNKLQIYFIDYNHNNSPFTFRSFVTYSTSENFATEAYVNTNFYVSRVIQLSSSVFWAKDKNDRNIWAAPSSFFIHTKIE